MKKDAFKPQEVLFSPTARCNLTCAHCDIKKYPKDLSIKTAVGFLKSCSSAGIGRVGFTGGEPFLTPKFLCALIREAVRANMTFSRIMTNGVWFKNERSLVSTLRQIHRAGYDGNICVSVDAFHKQDLRKVALFIRTVLKTWNRPDMISIAAVKGALDTETKGKLIKLSRILNGRLNYSERGHSYIRNDKLLIKLFLIDLSPVGKAALLKDPWDGKWFKDDYCKGPGNIFFVLPDGTVKPCCGYANDSDILTIGSIKDDSPRKLLRNARNNIFVSKIFGSGLHSIRRSLERSGVRFPGKTTNHCFFCHYIIRGQVSPFAISSIKK